MAKQKAPTLRELRKRADGGEESGGVMITRAIYAAAERFGGNDGTFNSAGFALALTDALGFRKRGLDGRLVRAILSERRDVVCLKGGHHWRMRWWRRLAWLMAARGAR